MIWHGKPCATRVRISKLTLTSLLRRNTSKLWPTSVLSGCVSHLWHLCGACSRSAFLVMSSVPFCAILSRWAQLTSWTTSRFARWVIDQESCIMLYHGRRIAGSHVAKLRGRCARCFGAGTVVCSFLPMWSKHAAAKKPGKAWRSVEPLCKTWFFLFLFHLFHSVQATCVLVNQVELQARQHSINTELKFLEQKASEVLSQTILDPHGPKSELSCNATKLEYNSIQYKLYI